MNGGLKNLCLLLPHSSFSIHHLAKPTRLQQLVLTFTFLLLLHRSDHLLVSTPGALGQLGRNYHAEGVLCYEGRDLSNLRPERAKSCGRRLVRQLLYAVRFGRAAERAAQPVKWKLAPRQHFSARLKIAERIEHHLL